MAGIRFESAQRWYPGAGRPAVPGIDLEVADGELMVLGGPSVCGRSTTLRTIAGREEVDDGSTDVGEDDVTDMARTDRDVAMVLQHCALTGAGALLSD
jgi:multiple sugar transport system ATP-binding protein